ncbi:hypothetical protein N8Z07_03255, partial [Pelagibacteraceae bacterium]|nr:hypothetical protein [Pelagibacteraceae bacterium]
EVINYGFGDLSKLNAIIITHDKDSFNSANDYSMFKNLGEVNLLISHLQNIKRKQLLEVIMD